MLQGKGYSWKATKARIPPLRLLIHALQSPKLLLPAVIVTLVLVLWRSASSTAGNMNRFYCWGPSKPPMYLSPNENEDWYAQHNTPVLFNRHRPVKVNTTGIEHVDLNSVRSTPSAVQNRERVLILTPLRDASYSLPTYFDLLAQLTYPHELIDLGFLVGDTKDDTLAVLAKELERVQNNPEIAFRSSMIVEKDFGVVHSQNIEDRHKLTAQGPRRKALGRARNYLLATALKPEHNWVYWRDVDVVNSPAKIIEDFVLHDRDILVPNVWFHRYEEQNGRLVDIEGRFDYNSWQESSEGLALAASLDKNFVLAEGDGVAGYKELRTQRRYMATEGNWRADKDVEMPLDGIGGVSIVVKANVHRSGINFPCYAFENQAETEGFAKMAKRAGYGVYGLPNYVVWHVDTEEKGGNA